MRRYQNPQSRIRKANPHAESVDHPVDRSAIPNLVVPICDRRPAKVGLASIPNYSMSLVFGYIVDRLIYAGLNLKNMAFYSDKFGVSNMARNLGFLIWVSVYYDVLIDFQDGNFPTLNASTMRLVLLG